MAYVTPSTVTAGTSPITAAAQNILVNNDIAFSPIVGAWTAYTPTFTNLTIGNGSTTAAYLLVGKTCFYSGRIDWGSTTTATAADTSVSIPFAAPAASYTIYRGSLYLVDSGVRAWVGTCLTNTTTTMIFAHTESGNFGGVNSTNPFTFGTNDSISWHITYQTA